jgi:hypothetical protein
MRDMGLLVVDPYQLDIFNDLPVEPRQLELFVYPPPPSADGQLELFRTTEYKCRRADELVMNVEELTQWKLQIYNYQQRVRETPPTPQPTLFDLPSSHCDPDIIDPLKLQLQSLAFYRMPADYPGEACLYFLVDAKAQLILYVGETCKSNKRWKGTHDSKDYIASYQDLHYRYKLETAVNIAFWWNTPKERLARQELELALIVKWRSPFNKENWIRWGQPFGKD